MAVKMVYITLWILHAQNIALGKDAFNLPIGCHTIGRRLTCEGHDVTRLPAKIPDSVTILHVKDANMHILDIENGSEIGQLTSLAVQNSRVTNISDKFFDKLSGTNNNEVKLQGVFINQNQITELKEGMFQSASYLQELSLSNNSLTSIHGVFKGLTSLLKLYLHGNEISEISAKDFSDLLNLTYLDLGRNKISTIGSELFDRNLNLQELILDYNILDEDNISLSDTTLHLVSMKGCELTQVPSDLPDTLRILQLSENNIRQISADDFDKYAYNLQELKLADNKIDNIQSGMLDELTSLKLLDLSGNRLHQIPGPFPNSIRFISLDNNFITTMRTDHFHWIGPFTFHIALMNNNISQITDNLFRNNIQVHSLQLGGNPIAVLEDGIFSMASSLHHLDLSHLQLTEIQENCLLGLEKVGILHMPFISVSEDKVGRGIFKHVSPIVLHLEESPVLADNLLKSITDNKIIFSGLKNLHLENNNLTSFPVDLEQSLPDVSQLTIAGNKFNCTQSLAWLEQWYLSKPHVFVDIGHAVCHTPNRLKGIFLDIVLHLKLYSDIMDSGTDDNSTYVHPTVDTIYDSGVHDYYYDPYIYDYDNHYDIYYHETTQQQEIETTTSLPRTSTTTLNIVEDVTTTTHTNNEIENVTTTTTKNVTIATLTSPIGTPRTAFFTTTADTEDFDNENRNVPNQHNNGESVSMKSVGIAIGMSFGVILGMLLLAFLIYKLVTKGPRSSQQNGHPATSLDYVFVAPKADRPDRPEPKVHRKMSRAERGSTTSHASEDITNHIDTNMRVYTLDMDE